MFGYSNFHAIVQAYNAAMESQLSQVNYFDDKPIDLTLNTNANTGFLCAGLSNVSQAMPEVCPAPTASSAAPIITEPKYTRCTICHTHFSSTISLDIHYSSHSKEYPFKCWFCERRFSRKYNMKTHLLTHNVKSMPNATSSNNFNNIEDVRNLLQQPPLDTRFGKKRPSEEAAEIFISKKLALCGVSSDSMEAEQPTNYVCEICTKSFDFPYFLHIHMKKHRGENPYLCNVCRESFSNSRKLKEHLRTHEKVNNSNCDW